MHQCIKRKPLKRSIFSKKVINIAIMNNAKSNLFFSGCYEERYEVNRNVPHKKERQLDRKTERQTEGKKEKDTPV